ncbi:MAG: PorP/SprF family type IX secretion system membrane protein [Crocinitomicaceae bacterium]|jgi:type IX secretion system PorP/SprF family membrane protein|nr:PorP/SprF family type IX secretion system membrane protein [Crocinitomicaceae bacterium]
MKFGLILTFLLMMIQVFGQDVHLSQFYTNDQLLNPGRMGNHGSDVRGYLNYRNQWRQINNSPLATYSVGGDKLFHYDQHDFNVGAMIVSDQFSGFNTVTNKFILTGSYPYSLGLNKLRGGVQVGVVTNSTDLSIQTFPNQWNYPAGEFDPNIPNGEVNIRPSQTYLDLNIGATWARQFGQIQVESGIAVNHVNRPKDTYFSSVFERRKMRGVFHATGLVPLNGFQLEPKIQWMWTTKANDYLFGSLLRKFTVDKNFTSFFGGLMYRHGINRTFDAVYPIVGLVYKQFEFGLSYDVNLSTLSSGVKRVKSAEFSLVYTMAPSTVKYKILPCDRY